MTKNIESLPCSILPAVDDMIPLNGVPSMRTWTANSRHVFERLCRSVTVKTGHAVLEVFVLFFFFLFFCFNFFCFVFF